MEKRRQELSLLACGILDNPFQHRGRVPIVFEFQKIWNSNIDPE